MIKSNLPMFILAGVLAAGFASCDKNKYEVPSTYAFDNVSYSGQTTRLNMMEAMTTYMKTANTPNATALNAQTLKDMYANQNGAFGDTDLDSSSKQLKSKTADSEQTNVDAYLDALATASLSTAETAPSNGTAGIYMKNDGSSGYLLNANGVELTQIVEKGLMGSCFYYQATAVYMGSGKMDVDNTTITEGEGTEMEHHWDEAFGYFGVSTDFPTNTDDARFWGKYCNSKADALLGSNASMMTAFITGRAAISANDLDTRDAMIDSLRRNWELVVVATAVSYLNDANANFAGDAALKHHQLSEAFAFIMGLKFGAQATVSTTDLDAILTTLGGNADPLQANFYNTTEADVLAARNALAAFFADIDAVKDQL